MIKASSTLRGSMIWTLIEASFIVWGLAVITVAGMKKLSSHSEIVTLVTVFTVFVASYILAQGTGIIGFLIILTSPIWVAGILAFIIKSTVGNLELALAKMGYLGTKKKWMYQLYEENDREYEAAKTLLSAEKKDELQSVSVSKKDFRDNVVEAAGIDEIEEKNIEETLLDSE